MAIFLIAIKICLKDKITKQNKLKTPHKNSYVDLNTFNSAL